MNNSNIMNRPVKYLFVRIISFVVEFILSKCKGIRITETKNVKGSLSWTS